MNDCKKIQRLMSEYIDKMLDPEDKKEAKEHIGHCEDCKKIYSSLKSTVKQCHQLDTVPLPQNFEEELHKKLRSADSVKTAHIKTRPRSRGVPYAMISGAAACLVLFIYANHYIGLQKNNSTTAYLAEPQSGFSFLNSVADGFNNVVTGLSEIEVSDQELSEVEPVASVPEATPVTSAKPTPQASSAPIAALNDVARADNSSDDIETEESALSTNSVNKSDVAPSGSSSGVSGSASGGGLSMGRVMRVDVTKLSEVSGIVSDYSSKATKQGSSTILTVPTSEYEQLIPINRANPNPEEYITVIENVR